jgi:hypothetical protein
VAADLSEDEDYLALLDGQVLESQARCGGLSA